jgi:hypothetical protein
MISQGMGQSQGLHTKAMLRAQCVRQILGVNIPLSLENKHTQTHEDGFQMEIHGDFLE